MKPLLCLIAGVLWSMAPATIGAPATVPSKEMLDFMRRFGYLEKGPSQAEALYSGEAIVDAIRHVQKFAALPETGVLDRRTIELMSAPRCGVVDVMQHDQSLRHRRYVIGSESWRKRRITYFIANWSSKVGEDSVAKFMAKAFDEWSKYSKLRFVRVYDPSADIIIGFGSGHHGDNYPFDGPGNILAHAFYPYEMNAYGGDIHFDEDENWKENSTHLGEGVDFYSVAIHELGHSLGLAHSPVYSSLMFPYYKGIAQGTLDYDDILAMYQLYIQNPHITDDPDWVEMTPPTTEMYIPTDTPAPRLPDLDVDQAPRSEPPLPSTTEVYNVPITFVGDYETVDEHIRRHYSPPQVTHMPEHTPTPDICSGSFDAIGLLRGEIFIFKGAYLWRLTEKYRIKEGYPVKIWQVFRGFPKTVTHIDAVYERLDDNAIVLFSGRSYWIFDALNFLRPEVRPLTDYGLPEDLERIDAAMVWPKNNKTYLFAGDRFWRYNDTALEVDEGYPSPMDRWFGIPRDIDAATAVASGKTYFFKGNYYWLYNNDRVRPERGYPRRTGNIWLGCR
ncbi:matrix metalloproteinase-2-like [Anopheles ziemanni]|uniref:matrix metalloproteinase-2-like n=1 Tax=Anopheles coustani TaxID=139045 RepID=UPI00265972E1|nr:matrix metalloproteinase-2-like [Anopheles coustani]XP_058168939.1 matrix metalloproteinase-2-like [Anopheles ziemanni]